MTHLKSILIKLCYLSWQLLHFNVESVSCVVFNVISTLRRHLTLFSMTFERWSNIWRCFQWHFNVEATSDVVFNDILTLKQRPTLFSVVFQSWNDVVRLLDITKVNTLSKPIKSPIVETETQSTPLTNIYIAVHFLGLVQALQ